MVLTGFIALDPYIPISSKNLPIRQLHIFLVRLNSLVGSDVITNLPSDVQFQAVIRIRPQYVSGPLLGTRLLSRKVIPIISTSISGVVLDVEEPQ